MTRLGAAMDVRFGASVEQFLEFLTDVGLDHLELKREYLAGHPDAPAPAEIRRLAAEYDVSVTLHAPFRDWNIGSFNDAARRESVARVQATLDDAATIGADAVVVHGGSVPRRYPEWVREQAADHARQSLRECAAYAADVDVRLCLENQPFSDDKRRYTVSPDALGDALAGVPASDDHLGVTLDVGHAKANGHDWRAYVDRFGDRITVCHLHDNNGTGDHHDPLTEYDDILETVPADYFVFEMKSVSDVAHCIGAEAPDSTPSPRLH
jgi:sugar phosphate isomerase/epimerase